MLTIVLLGGSYSASAFDAPTRALCYNSWTNQFYWTDANDGYFRVQQGTGTQIGFWCFAEGIEVVEDAVAVGLDSTNTVNTLCSGFIALNGTNWSGDPFNDDLCWASIAFSRAYQLTGNTSYNTYAENAFNQAYSRGYDPTDGGIFQSTSDTTPKATVASETCCVAGYLIYQNTGISSYLTKAKGVYAFMTNYCYIATNGMVEGAKQTPPSSWGLATSDNGMFAIASKDLGYTNNANLACDFVTNYWSISMATFTTPDTAGGPENGIGLRGMARIPRDPIFQQAACNNAWSKTNMYGLVFCNWAATTTNSYNLYCSDCMSVVAAMLCVPVISVTYATYEATNGTSGSNNVTSVVNGYVNNKAGSLSLVVNNTNMGGDPALGYVKQLVATCSIGGSLETLTIPENGTINVMGASGSVVSALYLPVDGFNGGTNVTSVFSSLGVRNVPINNTTMGGDPAPGHAKELKMTFSVGGNQETVVVLENSYLNL
jgi:hypothetical protein